MDDRTQLKGRIDLLQKVYAVLFFLSLVLLAANWFVLGHTPAGTVVWALSLGGAVATRLYRTSLVNRYNVLVAGGDAPVA